VQRQRSYMVFWRKWSKIIFYWNF